MHDDLAALQAQLTAANTILRHLAEWLNDAAFGPPLAQIRREVLGYFCLDQPGMSADVVAEAEVG